MFFQRDGIAVHGTYWHNDFGHPRSHGCVNVSIDAAKWIYRWTTPTLGYDVIFKTAETSEELYASTRVSVV
jgi:hypothetical protein